MPLFLTLCKNDGTGLVTAMLPPGDAEKTDFRAIIVGPKNVDPYNDQQDAIVALGRYFALTLELAACYPSARYINSDPM